MTPVPKKRGRPRTRPIKLTENEKRLLSYPPTKETWVCQNKYGEENVLCDMPNSGSSTECWLCRAKKPDDPILLWPAYVKICEKFNIDPELRKSVKDPSVLTKKGGEEEMRLFRRKNKVSVVFDELVSDYPRFPSTENVEAAAPVVETVVKTVDTPKETKPKATRKPRTTNSASKTPKQDTPKATTAKTTAKPRKKRTP